MNDKITAKEFNEIIRPKKSKYKNVKTEIDGLKFDSKKEANYYLKLKALVKSGEVISFERQVRFKFELNDVNICAYVADFVVKWKTLGTKVVDVKGIRTPMYNLKKKMMKAFHGIDIFEI